MMSGIRSQGGVEMRYCLRIGEGSGRDFFTLKERPEIRIQEGRNDEIIGTLADGRALMVVIPRHERYVLYEEKQPDE